MGGGRVTYGLPWRSTVAVDLHGAARLIGACIGPAQAVSADGRSHGYTKKIEDFLGHDE
ncbi:hypothetical protein GCM10023074_13070 [Microbispora amethystogenes]|uniref:Uncharacterized protein n=1 Tax=Microbispora amethystogenes TaxID=1427754 RepID=A0ABQ4F865_9ACTN|nr:hypothetical protein Mam01_11320 [Microbispora amethystogenes]